MQGALTGWDDTIVALATPPGIGAIAIIRLSGNKAITIVDELFPSKKLVEQKSHTIHVGLLKFKDEVLDEVVVSIYKNPTSYTGENIVEISCHGSTFIQTKILETLTMLGARIAKPGEFTQRAFLNGKLDLIQAESVADLIASNTEASRNNALKNIRGGFSSELSILREELIKFSALIELELDFSQEDVEFADRTTFKNLIKEISHTTNKLLQSFELGNVIKNGVQVAIIGKPNSGKSTLLNALLNEERAIVSSIAGTTRDTIEETLNISGILFRMMDTAGIRDNSTDEIEALGIERSKAKAITADVVLYLVDITSDDNFEQDFEWLQQLNKPFLIVANKTDIISTTNNQLPNSTIYISAKTKEHIDELKESLVSKILKGSINNESIIVTNARHVDALQKLKTSLAEIELGLNENITGDLLALDIRQSLYYLGTITGEVTNEEQLDFIFGKFCIGK